MLLKETKVIPNLLEVLQMPFACLLAFMVRGEHGIHLNLKHIAIVYKSVYFQSYSRKSPWWLCK